MKFVVSHYSKRSMDDFPDLLKMMFPDSQIVNEISLKCTKINYVINYGLKEYFHEVCMNNVKKTACFTMF